MDFKDLPKEIQNDIEGLKHGSLTIETDIQDSISQATDWEDAQETIESRMTDLIGEAIGNVQDLCGGEMVLVDLKDLAKKMVEKGIQKKDLLEGNFDGWTGTLVDLLEDHYSLETLIRKQITGEK